MGKASDKTVKELTDLKKLIKINSIINSTLDIGKLLNIIMEIIKDIMNAEASTLLLFEEATGDLVFKVALGEAGKGLVEKYRIKLGQGIAGWVAEKRQGIYINNVYDDERFDPNFDKITGFNTKALVCVPLLFKGKLIGVIQAINPIGRQEFDENDITLFYSFADQAVLAVQNAIFFQNALEEERIKNEISSAQSFNKSLLPDIEKQYNKIQFAAKSISAREVGGEFYDIFQYTEDSIGITVGGCHMKGLTGALNASILLGAVKGLLLNVHGNPASLLKNLYKAVKEKINKISLFYGLISLDKGVIQFINEGFTYPIIIRKNVARYLKFSTGLFNRINESPRKINVVLEQGDFFVIITDGIVNLKNRGAQNLGLKRIMDHLSGNFNTAREIIDSLNELADDFLNGLERREDISIIAFKYEG